MLAFLEGGLPDLRRAVVETHLESCVSCADLATWAAADMVNNEREKTTGDARPEGRAFLDQLSPGSKVGQYQILGMVGRGGMGEVYAAYHPDLDRRIALKVVYETGADTDERRGRLLREARAIARLSHPNVVIVHDAGVVGDLVFIAMEFIEGETLDAWLRSAPRTWRQILDVFVAAGHGLAAAHAAKIIHRDFKPQNVMIAKDGSVRVMDFGLARLVHEDLERVPVGKGFDESAHRAPATVTKTGALLGTPAYMAPEQFQRHPADELSDQFSFCVALHEALYGARPVLTHLQTDSYASVPMDDESRAPRRTSPPLWFRNIVQRGLSTDPAARWGSMEELSRALTRDPTAGRRIRLLIAGATIGIAAAAVSLARTHQPATLLCLGGTERMAEVWETVPAGPRREAARQAFVATGLDDAADTWQRVAAQLDRYASLWLRTYRDACEATHVRGEQSVEALDLRMACLNDSRGSLRALVKVLATARDRKTLDHAVDAVNDLPGLDRCSDLKRLSAAIEPPANTLISRQVESLHRQAATARAFYDTGSDRIAVEQGRALVAQARALGYRPILAELLGMLGTFEIGDGLPEAERTQEEAIWLSLTTHQYEIAAEAAALLSAEVGYESHRPQEGERWARLAFALLDGMGGGSDRIRAWVLNSQSAMRLAEGRLAEGMALNDQAMALKSKSLPPNHPDIAQSLLTQGECLHAQGDDAGALRAATRAVDIFVRAYGPNGPSVGQALSNRGEYLMALGRLEEALTDFRDGLRKWELHMGPDHQFLGYPLTGMGEALLALKRPSAALAPLERALRIREAHEPNKTLIAQTRFALARALWTAETHRHRAEDLATLAQAEIDPRIDPKGAKAIQRWLISQGSARR
jgi:eukaryotic-like serine/threonine-protein kinase